MISRLLGLHKHPSTKNLEEYKVGWRSTRGSSTLCHPILVFLVQGLKKTKSFFKDFLAQSKVGACMLWGAAPTDYLRGADCR